MWISYALENWKGPKMFVGNREMEIDNNLVENVIRPCAILKKELAVIRLRERLAVRTPCFAPSFRTAKRHGISPKEYLKDVLGRLSYIKADEDAGTHPGQLAHSTYAYLTHRLPQLPTRRSKMTLLTSVFLEVLTLVARFPATCSFASATEIRYPLCQELLPPIIGQRI